jgi:hypothetical protein
VETLRGIRGDFRVMLNNAVRALNPSVGREQKVWRVVTGRRTSRGESRGKSNGTSTKMTKRQTPRGKSEVSSRSGSNGNLGGEYL